LFFWSGIQAGSKPPVAPLPKSKTDSKTDSEDETETIEIPVSISESVNLLDRVPSK
jgi:hypothetical protein